MIVDELSKRGYTVTMGSILDDEEASIAVQLLKAVEEGHGLVITTGGVGAEDKDFTVEAVLKVDMAAATPWIVKY